jgi:hypothetical protein
MILIRISYAINLAAHASYMASKARPCNKHELARRGYVNAGLGLCKEITMIKSGSYNLEKNMVEIIVSKV